MINLVTSLKITEVQLSHQAILICDSETAFSSFLTLLWFPFLDIWINVLPNAMVIAHMKTMAYRDETRLSKLHKNLQAG